MVMWVIALIIALSLDCPMIFWLVYQVISLSVCRTSSFMTFQPIKTVYDFHQVDPQLKQISKQYFSLSSWYSVIESPGSSPGVSLLTILTPDSCLTCIHWRLLKYLMLSQSSSEAPDCTPFNSQMNGQRFREKSDQSTNHHLWWSCPPISFVVFCMCPSRIFIFSSHTHLEVSSSTIPVSLLYNLL